MSYDNEMTGVLFRNDRATNDRAPTHTGWVQINGVRYRVAAWPRETKNDGKPFLSLKLEPMEIRPAAPPELTRTPPQRTAPAAPQQKQPAVPLPDDDIPF